MSDTENMSISGKVTRYGDGWQYRGRGPDGKQFRKIGYTTKREANDDLNDKLHKLRVVGRSEEPCTLKEWALVWLKSVQETRRQTTSSNYKIQMRLHVFPYIGGVRLQDLTEEQVRECYRALVAKGLSSRSISSVHGTLKTCLKAAVLEGRTHRSVAQYIKPPKGKPERVRRIWTYDELHLFVKTIYTEPDTALWMLWVTSGLRRGEIAGIRWSSVDLENLCINIEWQRTVDPDTGHILEGEPKTFSGKRTIHLTKELGNLLNTLPKTDPCSKCGEVHVFGNFHPGDLRYRLGKLCEKAGLRYISPHELRHTYGTRAVEAGEDIKVLSKTLGHAKVEITMNMYVHPDSEMTRGLANRMTGRITGKSD